MLVSYNLNIIYRHNIWDSLWKWNQNEADSFLDVTLFGITLLFQQFRYPSSERWQLSQIVAIIRRSIPPISQCSAATDIAM